VGAKDVRGSRTLLLLGGLTALVLGWVVLDGQRPAPDRAGELRVAPGVRRDALSFVELRRRSGVLRFTRARDGFPEGVDELLSALEYGSILRRVGLVDDRTRAALGLTAPRLELVTDGLTLKFGEDAPGTRGVYVLRGAEVVVAERRLYELAARPAAAFAGADAGR
jgi:hypothetical protein